MKRKWVKYEPLKRKKLTRSQAQATGEPYVYRYFIAGYVRYKVQIPKIPVRVFYNIIEAVKFRDRNLLNKAI